VNTTPTKPRMGRINLPVPMDVKSIAVKAAQRSGMDLETWATKALEEQAKKTLLGLAWNELVQRLYNELREKPLTNVRMDDTGELRKWSPWYQSTEGYVFGATVQDKLRQLGIETTFEWDDSIGLLRLRRIPLINPPPGFQILFGQLPQPTSKTVTVEIEGGPYDRAEFEIEQHADGIHQLVYSATGNYKLTSLSSNADQKWVAEYRFTERAVKKLESAPS